jgi:hypothetical protein
MRATGAFPAHKPSAIGLFRADLPRAFLAFGFLTLCVALAFVANRSPDSGPGPRSHVSSEAELSTGSMLVVSPAGSRCRESTIDNSTWQIRNKGWVDCEDALAKSADAESRSKPSRIDIIREGFRGGR